MHLMPRHWWLGLAAAAAVHAGLITVALLRPPTPEIATLPPAGLGGVEIALGLSAGAAAAPVPPAAPVPAVPADATPSPAPPVEPARPDTAVPSPPAPPIAALPEAAGRLSPIPKPVPRPLPPRPAAEPPSADPLPARQPPARHPPADVPPRDAADASAGPPRQQAEVQSRSGLQPTETAAPAASVSESIYANPAPPVRTEQQTGSLAGAQGDYVAVLQAWLEKHKRYPRESRQRREQGEVLLRFVINREGQVLSFALEETSGYATLDREAEAMIQRAQPMPPMPETMTGPRLELVVPVRFSLR